RAPFAFRGGRSAIGVRGVGGRRNRLGGSGRGGRARGGDPARGRAGGTLLRYGTDLRRTRVRAPTGPRAQGRSGARRDGHQGRTARRAARVARSLAAPPGY